MKLGRKNFEDWQLGGQTTRERFIRPFGAKKGEDTL